MAIPFSVKYDRAQRDARIILGDTAIWKRPDLPVKTQPWWDGMSRSGKINADDRLTVHYYDAGERVSETFPTIWELVEKWSTELNG